MLPKINLPLFDVTVPSTKKKIKLRCMSLSEEKILLIAKQSGERSDIMNSVKQVVNNCIVDNNINLEKLAIFDLEYLFLKLRSFSVSNKSQVSYRDNEDDQVYDFEIDLDKLEIDMSKAPDNKITISKDIIIELNYPSVSLYINPKLYDTDNVETFDMLVANCLHKVYEGEKVHDAQTATDEEKKEFINALPAKSTDEIRTFLSNIPSLHHKITYKNSKGTEREIILNTLDDFFTL